MNVKILPFFDWMIFKVLEIKSFSQLYFSRWYKKDDRVRTWTFKNKIMKNRQVLG